MYRLVSKEDYTCLSVEFFIYVFLAVKKYFIGVCVHAFFINYSMYFHWTTLLLKETFVHMK